MKKQAKKTKPVKIKLGDKVESSKGTRYNKRKVKGIVTGFTAWREYEAVVIRKPNKTVVTCLLKNLTKI